MWEDIPEVQMMEKEIGRLKRSLSAHKQVLVMLSREEIGKWHSTAGEAGYWAGWDDAEYAIKKVLEGEDFPMKEVECDIPACNCGAKHVVKTELRQKDDAVLERLRFNSEQR